MQRLIASIVFSILLALLNAIVLGQNDSGHKNGNSAANSTAKLSLPNKEGGVRFLVIGDTGTGTDKQNDLAKIMLRYQQVIPFVFVFRVGDHMLGSEMALDY
jgi:hypothetical protein